MLTPQQRVGTTKLKTLIPGCQLIKNLDRNQLAILQQANSLQNTPTNKLHVSVVWKDTKRLGISFAKNARDYFVVANYEPAGNIVSRVAQNVQL